MSLLPRIVGFLSFKNMQGKPAFPSFSPILHVAVYWTFFCDRSNLSSNLSLFLRIFSQLFLSKMNQAAMNGEEMIAKHIKKIVTCGNNGWMVVTAMNKISGSRIWQWSGWWCIQMWREQNVTRTRNSKRLDTKNQQLDTRCNRKFNNAKTKW